MRLSQAVPELPVANLEDAVAHYRDVLGFEVSWVNEEGRIAGMAHGDFAVFLREGEPEASQVLWVFAADVDATHDTWKNSGADIVEPPEDKPWGLRQFTLRDMDGHVIHVHHDL